ncbi:MAG: lipopolysaccharide biosynthesis protein [Planctomycetota bacterium]
MSVGRKIANAALSLLIGQGLLTVLNIFIVHLYYRHLSDEERSIWFMLSQLYIFLPIFDFGIGFTLTRRFALRRQDAAPNTTAASPGATVGTDSPAAAPGAGKTGAQPDASAADAAMALSDTLIPGVAQAVGLTDTSVNDMVATGLWLYRFLPLAVLVLGGGIGCILFSFVHMTTMSHGSVYLTWLIVCASMAMISSSSLWVYLLQGTGYVAHSQWLLSLMRIGMFLMQIGVLMIGGRLLDMALLQIVAALGFHLMATRWVRKLLPPSAWEGGRWNATFARSIVRPAFQAWLVTLGAFLVLRTDQYFIALKGQSGLTLVADYSAMYLIVSKLFQVANAIANVSSVFVSKKWAMGDLAGIHAIVRRNLRIGLGTMVAGTAFLMFFGEPLFTLWIGKGHYVGLSILLIFCVMLTLEAQHAIVNFAARATEDEVYGPWAIGAGILNLILTSIFIQFWGLWGVAMATLVSQLVTNNWYGVYRGFKRMQMRFRDHVTAVLLPLAALFTILCSVSYGLLHASEIATSHLWLRLAMGAAGIGFGLAGYFWFFALMPSDRNRILARFHSSKTATSAES